MFCGTSDGVVSLWDTGKPNLPTYDGVDVQMLVKLFPDYGDVYNIAWSGSNRWLLAGTAAGLVGWNIEDNKVKEEGKDYKYVYLYHFFQMKLPTKILMLLVVVFTIFSIIAYPISTVGILRKNRPLIIYGGFEIFWTFIGQNSSKYMED